MSVDVHLNRLAEWRAARDLDDTLRKAARSALEAAESASAGELSITLVSDDEIRALNLEYLGRDDSTDVIAFYLGESGDLLGDIYIAPEAAERAAADEGIAVSEELVRLVVHGVLHVLGYHHPEGHERADSAMYRLQETVVAQVLGGQSRRGDTC